MVQKINLILVLQNALAAMGLCGPLLPHSFKFVFDLRIENQVMLIL